MITFTLDLEDHRPTEQFEKRYPEIIENILFFLSENNIKGTFFTVGEVAKNDPELIKNIINENHELAFHSYSHKQLQYEKPDVFKKETLNGKKMLEDISGQEVIGYRAPVFSLKRNTLWTLDILNELGFKYSSSVLPAPNPLNGFPEAPRSCFYWPNGLLEIPVPVIALGPVTIPYLGGIYLRYLPIQLIKYFVNKNNQQALWTYCHPYDFDPDEPYFKIKGASTITSIILWFNRRNTKNKLKSLLSFGDESELNRTFSEQFRNGDFRHSPVFNYK
jgi:polysaccharide deacetylase family protein (PEP-CTERM system associated)